MLHSNTQLTKKRRQAYTCCVAALVHFALLSRSVTLHLTCIITRSLFVCSASHTKQRLDLCLRAGIIRATTSLSPFTLALRRTVTKPRHLHNRYRNDIIEPFLRSVAPLHVHNTRTIRAPHDHHGGERLLQLILSTYRPSHRLCLRRQSTRPNRRTITTFA